MFETNYPSRSIGKANSLLRNVYLYMTLGVALTAAVSYGVASSPELIRFFLYNSIMPIILLIAQFAIVFILSSRIETMSKGAAAGCFFLYSALTGVTFSSIFLVYLRSTIYAAFITSSAMFFLMSAYASVTKRDLRKMSSYIMMALIGILIAGILNIFLKSTVFDFMISIVGVVLFSALTAYDTKKILSINSEYGDSMEDDDRVKIGILGALDLYLDFLNIFLYILRIMGLSRRD